MTQRLTKLATIVAASALLLSGCSAAGADSGSKTTVSFRLWDDTVADAYEESFEAFEDQNPDVDVEVNVVDWADYWTKLRTDVAGKTMDDLFWVNNSYFGAYADSGNLVDIDAVFGEEARSGWEGSVVKQFTRDGTLWGVPQLYDAGIAVYYNADLLEAADIDPAELDDLVWSPDETEDTYLPVAKQLTLDAAGVSAAAAGFDGTPVQYGTNLAYDLQAILLPFIGSNGGVYQDGDEFAFSDPKTVEAVEYLVDGINTAKVAPAAAETSADGDLSRDAFLNGSMALFQSGLYNLKNVEDGADFDWGVASIPAGPEGRVSVTNGVVVAGNAASDKQDAISKVLTWLGSEEGNSYLGAEGAAVPALKSAQKSYFDYWKKNDVDVKPFFDVLDGGTSIPAPTGPSYDKGFAEFDPLFQQIFTGKLDPADGLQQAEDAANRAIAG